ncbi:MAG: FeoA family protein [Pseudomonadota bacterium]|nr:FeoA family protein [Pseudomonadota bacterium]
MTLAELRPGQRAVVCGFESGCNGMAQRLMQLGLIEGGEIRALRSAPGGDPIEFRVMNYSLSLRRKEASQVLVQLVR